MKKGILLLALLGAFWSDAGAQISASKLQHLRADTRGRLSLSLDLAASNYVLAFYSSQGTGEDKGEFYRFSLGTALPSSKVMALSSPRSGREDLEAFLRHREQELAARLKGKGGQAAKRAAVSYKVGDRKTFVFPDIGNAGAQTLTATVVALNDKAVALVQNNLRANQNNLSTAQIKAVIDQFKNDYSLAVNTFGAPSDVDGDGKIAFLFSHLVDGVGGSTVGFFYTGAVVDRDSGGDGNLTDLMFISPSSPIGTYRATLVHEFQHLINFNEHVLVRGGESEVSWLNEGLSHVSEDLVANLTESGNDQNIAAFLADPGAVGLQGDSNVDPSKRGAAYLFVRSLADRLGPGVLRRLVQSGLADRDNLEKATGEKFEDLLALWAAQLYASGIGLNAGPQLNYTSPLLQLPEGRTFPLPATLTYQAGGVSLAGALRPRGVNFVQVSGPGTRTVAVETTPGAKVGVVVLPIPRDFVPKLVVPADYFPGLVLERPLPAVFSTGQEVVVRGSLKDRKLTQVAISFQPESGGEALDFYADVNAGRFEVKVVFGPGEVGTYQLVIFAGSGGSLSSLGFYKPIQVAKPAGARVPSAPALVLPANSSTGVAVTPTLQWQAVSGAGAYTVQVADKAEFGSVLFERKGLTGTSIALRGLLAKKRYYWRVNASNRTGTGPWSAVWSFTTAGGTAPEWTVFTSANSPLPGEGVYALTMDTNGAKWMGASGGLARFDGSKWTAYTTANSSIPADSIFAVAVEANGTKWIGTYGLGLARFDGSKWATYDTGNSPLPSDWVFALAAEGNGTKWIGTSGGLARLDGSRWTIYNTGNSRLPGDEVYVLAIEANGAKWMGTSGGLARFDGSRWTTYTTANSPMPADLVYALAIEANGTKWIGTSGGLARFDGSKWTVYTTANSSLPGDEVYAVAVEANGTKWVGTYGQGLARFDGSTWTTYTTANSPLPGDAVYALAVDKSGAKWVCTSGGLALLTGGASGALGKPVVGEAQPAAVSLGPNYPNPFNPATTLSYSLLQSAQVQLAIYNLAGQQVRLLAQGYRPAGQHTAVWDGRDEAGREVASGVYFSRLQAQDPPRTQTRPMLLLR